MQLGRLRYQSAAEFSRGYKAAVDAADLPWQWFDAVVPHEEEADELMYKVNSARSDSRVSRRRGPF